MNGEGACVAVLLACGAHPNLVDGSGRTPADCAQEFDTRDHADALSVLQNHINPAAVRDAAQ